MSKAETGIYCGPLRLLAMEVYDSLNAQGTLCNLLTGRGPSLMPASGHPFVALRTSSSWAGGGCA